MVVDRLRNVRILADGRETALQYLLLSTSLEPLRAVDAAGRICRSSTTMLSSSWRWPSSSGRSSSLHWPLQHRRHARRADEEETIVVAHEKCAPITPHRELTLFEHFAILATEHGEEDLVGERRFRWEPLDIEVLGEK